MHFELCGALLSPLAWSSNYVSALLFQVLYPLLTSLLHFNQNHPDRFVPETEGVLPCKLELGISHWNYLPWEVFKSPTAKWDAEPSYLDHVFAQKVWIRWSLRFPPTWYSISLQTMHSVWAWEFLSAFSLLCSEDLWPQPLLAAFHFLESLCQLWSSLLQADATSSWWWCSPVLWRDLASLAWLQLQISWATSGAQGRVHLRF